MERSDEPTRFSRSALSPTPNGEAAFGMTPQLGQTAGLAAGFDHARGEYIIAMDGDLQHDPADIPPFSFKKSPRLSISSAAGARIASIISGSVAFLPCANWLMAKLSGVEIHDFGTTFKAYRRDSHASSTLR